MTDPKKASRLRLEHILGFVRKIEPISVELTLLLPLPGTAFLLLPPEAHSQPLKLTHSFYTALQFTF